MGLDMYLKASKYIGGWEFSSDEEKETFNAILETAGMEEFQDPESPSLRVIVTVGYWRKANAIHAWFVDNVQDGVDECQDSYVSREQLKQLRDIAREALEAYRAGDLNKAGQLLTPRSGFFFGSTKIDEWYAKDLEHTVVVIDRLLKIGEGIYIDFYYHASW